VLAAAVLAAPLAMTIPAPAAAQQVPLPAGAALPPPQAAPPRPPLPNRANELLPAWLRVRGEFRERVEGVEGAGFAAGRDDAYSLSRVRLDAVVTPSSALSFQAQVQDARVALKDVGPSGAPFKGTLDVRQAFADVGSARAPVALRVGRQELFFGEQRLVGHLAWVNNARTWDGVRLTLRRNAFTVNAFGASLVRSLDGRLDRSGAGNRFAGAYASIARLIPRGAVEPFLFWRRDVNLRSELGAIGDLRETTVGTRIAGRLPARLDYGIEMAAQTGALASDRVSAWAGHWQLRATLPGPGAVRLTSEYNRASGDDNPADGIRRTFDQLYPTGHDKLGLADQVGWRNIHHLREGVEFTPFKATPITASYHSWWLADRRDGLYAANGNLIARVAAGAASRHVGQELDVQVSRALTPQLQLAAGYAHLFTAAFLKEATPGAAYSYPYVMATYVFLAEK
jgi:hypothetical protein